MLTKLIFPPQWIPTQPYLSVPSLTAFLRSNHCEVEQLDLNILFYDEILKKNSLEAHFKIIFEKFQELESQNELIPDLKNKYVTLSSSILFSDYIIREIEHARKILNNKEKFYEIDELFKAFKILELGLKFVSSAYYPTNLTFHAYDMRNSCRSSGSILEAINNREENLFIDYFEKMLPEILENKPGLVGISIINTSQLIPGLTLANLIKKNNSDIHINIGGSVFTRLINELSKNTELFSIFDSVIVHEGETALLELIKCLEDNNDLNNVPNLIHKNGADIIVNELSSNGEDINSLPTPTFDGFPLGSYFSPELVLPVLSSRGCYWKRCTFCDHSYGYSGRYRPRNVDLIYSDLDALKKRYNTGFFTFQDEGLSPKLIGSISDKIIENGLDISWLADSRFEPVFDQELAHKIGNAGCIMIYFGLESANERILKCMDKGIDIKKALKICKYTTNAGIWNHLFLIFGFPTETVNEARETMDFVLENSDQIRSVAFGSFQLTKHSIVYEDPASFDVNIIRENETDFSLWYDYKINKGTSKKETDDLIQEFYSALSMKYRDFPIWGNLDREHLFLYISKYKNEKNMVPDLTDLINRVNKKRSIEKTRSSGDSNELHPVLYEGIFTGTFNFNLAQIIHNTMAGNDLENTFKRERTNVLFDTNNNRIFTISDLGKDILTNCTGGYELSEIITSVREKHQLSQSEAGSKCKTFLQGLYDKNILKF